MTYGPLQVRDVIHDEMEKRKGRTVISGEIKPSGRSL